MRLFKSLNILLLLTIYLINLPQICYSEEKKLVVLGTPIVKVESFPDQTKRHELTKKQMKEYQVIISQEGNNIAEIRIALDERIGSRSVLSMKINPLYDFIRDDPRFVEMLKETNLYP